MHQDYIRYKDKGAHFHRCDFQVHSPRDRQWKPPKNKPVSEKERTEYARSLIKACRNRGVNAIAVTDHHDMIFIPYIKKAAKSEFETLEKNISTPEHIVVFPGIELTLVGSYQAIILFEPDFDESKFNSVLDILNVKPSPSSAGSTANIDILKYELLDLERRLEEKEWLKNKYIIFPNVTKRGKHSILRQGMRQFYIDMPYIGGYLDGSESELDYGSLKILNGEDVNWGSKSIAYVQTSDSRSKSHENLGNPSSWIKWTHPTTEALRQACLAKKSRIFNAEPPLPSIFIESINIKNSTFLGSLNLSFNPQYNVLIGSRGTGKSSIFEYVRWALCDQSPRHKRMIESTLSSNDAIVEVTIIKDGKPHRVRRFSRSGTVQYNSENGEFVSCDKSVIRKLMPIQAYSQKQLSELSDRKQELAKFIRKPIEPQLSDLAKQISDQKKKILETVSRHGKRIDASKKVTRLRHQKEIFKRQANQIRALLGGMVDKDKAIIEAMPDLEVMESQISNLEFWLKTIEFEILKHEEYAMSIVKRSKNLSSSTAFELLEIKADVVDGSMKFFTEVRAELNTICRKISQRFEEHEVVQLRDALTNMRKKYDDAVERSTTKENRRMRLKYLESQVKSIEREIEGETYKLVVNKAVDSLKVELEPLIKLREMQHTLIQKQCSRLYSDSYKQIDTSVSYNTDQCCTVLRDKLNEKNISESKVDSIVDVLIHACENDKFEVWAKILHEVWVISNGVCEQPGSTSVLESAGLNGEDRKGLHDSFNSDDWKVLLGNEFDIEFKFKCLIDEGKYIDFANASLGQQSTSLLLALINAESEVPLLIDQPEEDLDNRIIQRVANSIQEAKMHRQIIFVSHNASLVVNGDAELVICCDGPRKPIDDEGSIDVKQIRDKIIRITDGGETAFDLRRKKYGF